MRIASVLVVLAVFACENERADKAQADLDRAIERAGGIERDKDGRAYKRESGRYLDQRGGTVTPEAIARRPGALPPEPPETDLTRGQYAELMGDTKKAAALFAKACSENVPGGCAHVALAKRLSEPKQAVAGAKQLCDDGDAWGCYALGMVYETAVLDKKPAMDDILATYDKGCAGGAYDACHALAMLYYSGRSGAPKDLNKAVEALTRACELGDRQSCLQIGSVMDKARATAAPTR